MSLLLMTLSMMMPLAASDDPLARHGEIARPKEWEKLVFGGQFRDRILPAPIHEGLETEIWGADGVVPRDIHNGIEDPEWSYWGGRPILEPNGTYHLFASRWREDAEKGHKSWKTSVIVHAVSDRPTGPFKVKREIGPGHFPEIHKLPDGRYVVYHFHGCYAAEDIDGPWTAVSKNDLGFGETTFGSLAVREDGSLLLSDRTMRKWIKEKGTDRFVMVTGEEVHPARPAKFSYEDPMIWRTEVQYHLLVNDWHGRIGYHLRSKDGVHWKEDPGEAFGMGVDRYEDGTQVDWYKYERPKVLQDKHGRATHLYLAVIDVPKRRDRQSDAHSSKTIVLPLVVGRRLEVLNDERIGAETQTIRLRIKAEEGFDPHADINLASLRFGAPEVVDFGGGCKPSGSGKAGSDLIVTFDAAGHGFGESNFAGKLLGRTADGKLLFGYSRLPGVDYSPYELGNAADAKTD